MKRKRRSIALLLALAMCLFLLSACGANKTEEAAAPESVVDTAGQQKVVKEEPKQEPEQEEAEETEEPEEEEPEEPAQEEPETAEEPTQQPEESEVPALDEMTYTFDAATGTLTCSGGGEVIDDDWLDVVKNTLFETDNYRAAAEVKKVVVERGITSLARDAFESCQNLTEVVLPDTLTRIGECAFQRTALTSIAIPESVTEFGYQAFEDCQTLSSVNLPGDLTEIPNELFMGCTNLTSIEIPKGVTRIGSRAFCNTGLTELVIPEGVTVIESDFIRGTSITSITLPTSLTRWSCNIYSTTSVTDVTFLCEGTMDNVALLVENLLNKPVTIHAPAGSVIEGYVNRQIQTRDDVKCTFVPIN